MEQTSDENDDLPDSDVTITELESRSPNEHNDPYEDVDVDSLPEWWRRNVREFQESNLRPYHPPRFADGILKREVVTSLENELNVDIRFVGYDVEYGDAWTVLVDGEAVGDIPRERSPAGYTVFMIESDEFENWIRRV